MYIAQINRNRIFLIIIVLFAVLYSLISIVNHINFRTYALDLGLYTNALYDYIHFQWNDSSLFKVAKENLLADHFDLYLIIFSPLSLIFKTYTLLIVQIIALLLGGFGIFKYFNLSSQTAKLALFAALYFYLFYGVYSALAFDYHSNVVAAALVPWLFYYIKQRKLLASSLFILFILISKENISLWIAFVALGLAFEYRKESYLRNYLIVASVFCLVYFVLITNVVMPSLSNNAKYAHFDYTFLGKNAGEAILHLLQHPLESLKALFINHNNAINGDYVKMELFSLLLISGLPLLLLKPQYLFMLIPIFFQKLFHDREVMWSVVAQYSIEFAPIMAIGIFMGLNTIKKTMYVKILAIIVLIGVFGSTIRIMDRTVMYSNKSNIRIYQSSHYKRDYSIKKTREILSKLPKNAAISTQSPFVAQLAYRDKIYQFPIINDADYIIYSEHEGLYPLPDKASFDSIMDELKKSGKWILYFKSDELTLLKRIN